MVLAQTDIWAQTGILGVIVAAVVIAGIKRVWMFRWTHDDIMAGVKLALEAEKEERERERREKEEWKQMALAQRGVVQQTIDRAAAVVEKVVEQP